MRTVGPTAMWPGSQRYSMRLPTLNDSVTSVPLAGCSGRPHDFGPAPRKQPKKKQRNIVPVKRAAIPRTLALRSTRPPQKKVLNGKQRHRMLLWNVASQLHNACSTLLAAPSSGKTFNYTMKATANEIRFSLPISAIVKSQISWISFVKLDELCPFQRNPETFKEK